MALNFTEILTFTIWNNSVKNYLLALAVLVLTIIVFKIFKYWAVNKIKKLTAKTRTELDDLLIKIIDQVGWPFYILLSLFIALQFIQIPNFIEKALYYLLIVIIIYYVVRGVQNLLDYGTDRLIAKRQQEETEADTSVIEFLSKIFKGVLWGIAVILIVSNLGYNVSALVAGLGIGGIAIAIALQNVLSDIFSSFSIYFDKPFQVGDFIIVGDNLGVVKKIGIKSTRLQSLWGQEVVISNRELTDTRVSNYKKMERRRIHFTFGVVYNTSTEKLKKILEIIKEAFDKIELADLDRVHFKEFGNFSLNFEVAYYVNTGDYAKYMDIQQEVNLSIKERFEKEGIEFAYPTQTVIVNELGHRSN